VLFSGTLTGSRRDHPRGRPVLKDLHPDGPNRRWSDGLHNWLDWERPRPFSQGVPDRPRERREYPSSSSVAKTSSLTMRIGDLRHPRGGYCNPVHPLVSSTSGGADSVPCLRGPPAAGGTSHGYEQHHHRGGNRPHRALCSGLLRARQVSRVRTVAAGYGPVRVVTSADGWPRSKPQIGQPCQSRLAPAPLVADDPRSPPSRAGRQGSRHE